MTLSTLESGSQVGGSILQECNRGWCIDESPEKLNITDSVISQKVKADGINITVKGKTELLSNVWNSQVYK